MTSTYLLTAALVASLSPPPPALTTTLLRANVEEPADDGTADVVAAEDMAEETGDSAVGEAEAEAEAPEDAPSDGAEQAPPGEEGAAPPTEITIPSKKGTGALITAGVLGGFAISMMGLRVARIKRFCTTGDIDPNTEITEDDLDQIANDAANCFIAGRGANAALWVFQAAPNAAAYGLAPAGALRRAKHDAAVSVATGDDSRNPGSFIGAGAALLGVGVTGRIIVAVLRIRSLNPLQGVAASCVVDGSTLASDFFDCYGDRNAILYGAHQLTASSIAAGAGLLTYGVAYKRERETIRTVYGLDKQTSFEFSVQPQLALTYTGAAATLRF
ncbi:MAG: hypothetical protein KC486_05715 [Myxococcales bacterium]|nr:hypothetical protein [Myxococcales bacterium]